MPLNVRDQNRYETIVMYIHKSGAVIRSSSNDQFTYLNDTISLRSERFVKFVCALVLMMFIIIENKSMLTCEMVHYHLLHLINCLQYRIIVVYYISNNFIYIYIYYISLGDTANQIQWVYLLRHKKYHCQISQSPERPGYGFGLMWSFWYLVSASTAGQSRSRAKLPHHNPILPFRDITM